MRRIYEEYVCIDTWEYLYIYAISKNNYSISKKTYKFFLQYFWSISKASPKNVYAMSASIKKIYE